MARVKAGRIFEVDNKLRKTSANKQYYAVYVEDTNGGNERCLLFTKNQLLIANRRALRNKEDLLKKSFLTDILD